MAISLTFGVLGNAQAFQRGGWSPAEAGFTWSVGEASRLAVPRPPGGGDLCLEVHLRPFVAPSHPGQLLIVAAGGAIAGEVFLCDETIISLRIPAAVSDGREIAITFHQLDARSPHACGVGQDTRELGFAFQRVSLAPAPKLPPFQPRMRPALRGATVDALAEAARFCSGLALAELAACFESLGRNCEFGLIQRQCGADPISLLRFASIAPPRLLAGVREGFAGIAGESNLELYQIADDPSREWLIRDRLYATETHTFETERTALPEKLLPQAIRRYGMLQRKFMESLRLGDKIRVFQHPRVRNQAIVEPIAAALAAHGPNMLLWVAEGTGMAPGCVMQVRPGLLLGAIGKLAAEGEADKGDLLCWIAIMANAYRLWREAGYGKEEVLF